jgi:catalase
MARKTLTTDQGVPVPDNQNSFTAGQRGQIFLHDVHPIGKPAHFDRERIPGCVVHAKGAGAHGYFLVSASMAAYTKCKAPAGPEEKDPGHSVDGGVGRSPCPYTLTIATAPGNR